MMLMDPVTVAKHVENLIATIAEQQKKIDELETQLRILLREFDSRRKGVK
jgi:uncharacterized coiled-coil protein SlyX